MSNHSASPEPEAELPLPRMQGEQPHAEPPLLIPAPLVRVRRLLCRCGLKVAPWSDIDQTLDVLHDVLKSHTADPSFWQQLGHLLADLGSDAERRSAESVVDNDLLGADRLGELLGELRAALQKLPHPAAGDLPRQVPTNQDAGRFRRLAQTLSLNACGMLMVIAGVATVGCGGKATNEEDAARDGGPGLGGSLGSNTGGTGANSGTGGSAGRAAVAAGGTGAVSISPATGGASEGGNGGATSLCTEDDMLSLSAVIADCIQGDDLRERLVDCALRLNASWMAGMEELLACRSCDEVRYQLECLLNACGDPSLPDDFSVDELLNRCNVSIYVGVAFE